MLGILYFIASSTLSKEQAAKSSVIDSENKAQILRPEPPNMNNTGLNDSEESGSIDGDELIRARMAAQRYDSD